MFQFPHNIVYTLKLGRGEALALTAGDIDMKARKLKINKSLDISENTSKIKVPKTKAGYRELPIPTELYNELVSYMENKKSMYLFHNSEGCLLSRSSFRRMWESIIKKTQRTADEIAEKEGKDGRLRAERDTSITFTPHIFRHTYATNLYYAGVDVKKKSILFGAFDNRNDIENLYSS